MDRRPLISHQNTIKIEDFDVKQQILGPKSIDLSQNLSILRQLSGKIGPKSLNFARHSIDRNLSISANFGPEFSDFRPKSGQLARFLSIFQNLKNVQIFAHFGKFLLQLPYKLQKSRTKVKFQISLKIGFFCHFLAKIRDFCRILSDSPKIVKSKRFRSIWPHLR